MTPRRGLALLVVAVALTAIAALAPSALGRSQAKATVTATDFKFKWVPAQVVRGVATITVVNKGQASHDLIGDGEGHRDDEPGRESARPVGNRVDRLDRGPDGRRHILGGLISSLRSGHAVASLPSIRQSPETSPRPAPPAAARPPAGRLTSKAP